MKLHPDSRHASFLVHERDHACSSGKGSVLRASSGLLFGVALCCIASGAAHGQDALIASTSNQGKSVAATTSTTHPSETTRNLGFARGHILVQPRPGLSDAEFAKVLAPHGGKAVKRLGSLNLYVVSLPANASEQAVAHALAQHPHIKFAEVDQFVAPDLVPNDPYYGSEWHLQTMHVPAAWNYSIGTGVTVAILDSGIDATHPDLQGQLVPGWNFFDNNSNTADVYGHGTKVAGVVAAVGYNSIGVAGISWGSQLMPVRVTDTTGTGTWSAIASGLNWAADHGAKVANLSFAVQASSSTQTAAQYFKNKGGVVVNSAGNYGTLDSTAPSDALISVSATDGTDTLASWSSYGPYVDLSAPGVSIWTTTMGGGYSAVSGTSFSSPATAAVAALMMTANPALSPTQIVSLLESTAVDLGAAGYDYYYGYGRVDAGAAVLAAAQGVAADTQPPSVAIASPTGGSVSGIVPVNVSASDNVGVTHVDLLVNGAVLASDTTTPYGFSWDTSSLVGTSAMIVARAYDAAGNAANSQTVNVTVSSGVITAAPDTTPPSVVISSPTNGSKVNGTVTISATGSDNVAVASLSLYLDGSLVSTGNTSSLSYKWNARKVASGAHTINAVARDTSGNQATTTIQVTK